jgi:hypothetical protein
MAAAQTPGFTHRWMTAKLRASSFIEAKTLEKSPFSISIGVKQSQSGRLIVPAKLGQVQPEVRV